MKDPVDSWNEVLQIADEFKAGTWCFRGEAKRGSPLKTSLENHAIDRWGRDWRELPAIEKGLLRRFKREAHLYVNKEPADNDLMGWLSLIRHHEGPTRLLDWTYSFMVALFFAVSGAKPGREFAVWAINLSWLREKAEAQLSESARLQLQNDPNAKDPKTVKEILDADRPQPLVYPLNPMRMNRRLILQQGVFLVPGQLCASFMDNLEALPQHESNVREIPLSGSLEFKKDVVRQLLAMNISSSTLFPGLDGFARTLSALIPFPELRVTDEPGVE